MKTRKNCLLVAICAVVATLSPISAQVSEPIRVAVLEFEVKGNPGMKDAGSAVAEWLSASIQRTGKYRVLERVLLGKVLEEQSIALSGMIDEKTSAKIGALFGAQAIVTGSLVEWSGRLTLSARLIDVGTGSVISSAVLRTAGASQLPDRMDDLARVLAGIQPPEILERDAPAGGKGGGGDALSVVKAEAKGGRTRIVLDRGSLDKVTKGMAFAVMMPEYGNSEVTGARVVLGTKRVGAVAIDYVEPRFCAGDFLPELFVSIPPEELRAEALAIPASPISIYYGLGSINAGGGLVYSFDTKAGSFASFVAYEAAVPSLGVPLGGEFLGLGYEYPVLGNRFSASRFSLGAGVAWRLMNVSDTRFLAGSGLVDGFAALAYVSGRLGFLQIRLGARKSLALWDMVGESNWTPSSAMLAVEPFVSVAIGLGMR